MECDNRPLKRGIVIKKGRTSREEKSILLVTSEDIEKHSSLSLPSVGPEALHDNRECEAERCMEVDENYVTSPLEKSNLYPESTAEFQALSDPQKGCALEAGKTEVCNQVTAKAGCEGTSHEHECLKFDGAVARCGNTVLISDVTFSQSFRECGEVTSVCSEGTPPQTRRKFDGSNGTGGREGVALEGHSKTLQSGLCGTPSQGQRDATDKALCGGTDRVLLGDADQASQGTDQTLPKATDRKPSRESIVSSLRTSEDQASRRGIDDRENDSMNPVSQAPGAQNCSADVKLPVGTPGHLHERDRVEAVCASRGTLRPIARPNEAEWGYIRTRAMRVPGCGTASLVSNATEELGGAEVVVCGDNRGAGGGPGQGNGVLEEGGCAIARPAVDNQVAETEHELQNSRECREGKGANGEGVQQSCTGVAFKGEQRKYGFENGGGVENENVSDLEFGKELTRSGSPQIRTSSSSDVSQMGSVVQIERIDESIERISKTTELIQGTGTGKLIKTTKTNTKERKASADVRRRDFVIRRRNQAVEVLKIANQKQKSRNSDDVTSKIVIQKQNSSNSDDVTSKIVIQREKSRSSDDVAPKMKFYDSSHSAKGQKAPVGTIEDQMDDPVDLLAGDMDIRKSKSHSNLFSHFNRKVSSASFPKDDFPSPLSVSSDALKTVGGPALGVEDFKWVQQNKGLFYLNNESSDRSGSLHNLPTGKDSLYPRLNLDEERAAIGGLPTNEKEDSDRKASVSAPMAMLFNKLMKGADIMQHAVTGGSEWRLEDQLSSEESDALLSHVLHALVHVLGSHATATWLLHADALASPATDSQQSPSTEVTLASILAELQDVFQIDDTKIQETLRKVNADTERQAPELALHLHIHEAKDLKMKSVAGSANPYVTASLPWDAHRTRLLHQTRCPAWDQRFAMKVKSVQQEALKLEVWHEHEHLGVGVVKDIRDLKGLGRLVKGTAAPDHLLLGVVTLPLKEVPEDGLESWFQLVKEDPQQTPATAPNLPAVTSPPSHFSLSSQLAQLKTTGASLIHHGAQKPRGQLRIGASFGPLKKSGPSSSRRSYEALLVKVLLHHVDAPDNMVLWSGKLPPAALCALHITALVDGLGSDDKLLGLWNVACRTDKSDSVWLAEILARILSKDKEDLPPHALDDVRASLLAWLSHVEDKLVQLHVAFPPTRGVSSSRQLGGLLRGLRQLSKGRLSSELLKEKSINVDEVVKKAVEKHISQWWLGLLERELKDTLTPDDQVIRVINITNECHDFISQATSLYSPVFVNDFSLPYLRIVYLFITKKLNPCVRPLLMNIYSRLLSSSSHDAKGTDAKSTDAKGIAPSDYALSAGSNLWQLYVNLGRIHRQGSSLPQEVREESGLREYHRWFSKGVMHWLQVAQARIQGIISNAVAADQLVPCDDFCAFSSSATDAVTVFVGVRNWWLELAWPDPQNSGVLLGKVLEDLCSCAIFYCDLLRHKVDSIYEAQQGDGKVFITKQICIGLNNMERVREEVATLPDSFRVSALLDNIAAAGVDPHNLEGDRAAADQFRGTFDRLISSSMENMEAKVKEFVEAVVDKVSGILLLGLTDACEAQDPDLLLGEVLDPGLSLMRHSLRDACFRRFLLRLWECLLQLTRSLVVRSAERRKAEFFNAVHDTLSRSLQFFTPPGGLSMEEAMTDEYTSLVELLATLRLSSEQLIGQYYQERAEERQLMGVTSRGELFVNVFFTPSSKLVVEIVMARDFQVEDEVSSVSSRTSHVGLRGLVTGTSHVPVDAYVKVQLVPVELFPSAQTFSTKVLKRSDPAIFQETFTYVLSPDDPSVKEGFLLLTLKDHNVARSNTFLGEAVVALGAVPSAPSDAISSQPKTSQLKLTKPGMEAGYKPLATLRLRAGSDRVASAFMKKISARFVDPRVRKESRDLALPSTDDERSPEKAGRSPKIFDRFFKQES